MYHLTAKLITAEKGFPVKGNLPEKNLILYQ